MDLGKKLRQALSKLTNRPYVDKADVKALIKDLQRVLIASDVNVKASKTALKVVRTIYNKHLF